MSEPLAFGHFRVATHLDGSPIELGRGTMGVTYKAFDERLRIDVALKIIAPAQVNNPRAQSLFLREARAAARVRHSNVASVLELDDTPGRFFFAMEFIDGRSLKEWMIGRIPIRPALAISIATQIARGLEAIHEQGVVHRDLKPANVMLVRAHGNSIDLRWDSEANPDNWNVKIIDFGVALASLRKGADDTTATQTVGFRGTALYASPEQCAELGEIDGRSDLYSLGCIIWEMLCGAPPFQGRTQRELFNQHVSESPPLKQLANLPPSLAVILARLLKKEPNDRFPNESTLIKALDESRARIDRGEEATGGFEPTATEADTSMSSSELAKPTNRSQTRRNILIGTAGLLGVAALSWLTLRPKSQEPVLEQTPRLLPNVVAPSGSAAQSVPRKSVAVLPFDNLSSDKENEYFADGIQEDVLTNLANLHDLKVISRTSVLEYRGKPQNLRKIASDLNVANIVEGTVRRSGNSVRVTVQLIDASTDEHLWAEKYDRPLADVFKVQTEIAEAIAAQLKIQLSAEERISIATPPTTDTTAYEFYLQARSIDYDLNSSQERRREAINLLNKAIARDPEFYLARCLRTKLHIVIFGMYGSEPDRLLAEEGLNTIKRMRPNAGETNMELGRFHFVVDGNYRLAKEEFKAATDLLPNSAEAQRILGDAERALGHSDEAIRAYQRAIELDPKSARTLDQLGIYCYDLRRYDDAVNYLSRALVFEPGSSEVRVNLAWCDLSRNASLTQTRSLVDDLLEKRPPDLLESIDTLFLFALYDRNPALASRIAPEIRKGDAYKYCGAAPLAYFVGQVALLRGDKVAAVSALAEALKDGALLAAAESGDVLSRLTRAEILGCLGRKSEALTEWQRAYQVSEARGDRRWFVGYRFAAVLAGIGDAEEAIALLVTLDGPIYGSLCLDPAWDPLRRNPHFQKLVSSLAPPATSPPAR
jgi:serine/threonine protein kinase/tetratricopeptide (TPR) repeat protein